MAATRRSFVAKLAAVGAFLPAMPRVCRVANMRSVCDENGLPIVPVGPINEDFWRDLRNEFLMPRDEAFSTQAHSARHRRLCGKPSSPT